MRAFDCLKEVPSLLTFSQGCNSVVQGQTAIIPHQIDNGKD